MKKFIALAVVASATASFASDNREIQDIMYLPNAGTTYGFSTGTYTKRTIEAAKDTDISGHGLSQTFGYALTDRLSLEGSINYANLEYETGEDTTEQTGISDPTVGARFRTMDESFRWDILGGATISLGDKELDDDGFNNYQGGSSLFAGTQFGGKSPSFQWALTGLLTHFMERTTDIDGFAKIEQDSTNGLLLRADILNTLGEKSFLRSNVAANFAEETESDDTSPGVDFSEDSATTYSIGTEYQHKMSTDFLLRAGVNYASINQDTSNNDDDTVWNFLAGANYQF